MFLCHSAPQRHKHSVIEVQFVSSQNISFYISLTFMRPIQSIEKNYLFFYIYIYFAKEL